MHRLRLLFEGKSLWAAAAALRWKLSTAIQKRFILLQDRFGWYEYPDWIRENEGEVQQSAGLKMHAEGLAYRPRVSLLIPWENPSLDGLSDLLKILAAQWYENWEGCLILGSNIVEGGFEAADRITQSEPRMRLKNADSTSISQDLALQGLEMASGEFVLLLEGGDILSPQLLSEMVLRLNENPNPDILYTDEDHFSADGKTRLDPFFKPDWSPELLLSTNYLRHALFRASPMKEAAAQTPSGEAGGYDELIFRCIEAARDIGHIPKVLYHNRVGVSSDLRPARLKSIEGHLQRTGVSGAQATILKNSQVKVTWPVKNRKVSIIIPTRDHVETLSMCIQTLRERTSYPNYELILVDNGSCEGSTHEYYAQIRKDPDLRILDYREPFNYSAANNLGARNATGDIFLFLNNDTEIIEPEWLEELVRWAERPEIGVVGARLLYPDGSIQHTGIVVGMEGHGSHVFTGAKPQRAIFGSMDWYRNTCAVTGACMAVRREVFIQAGGFDEDYELVFNDIEFCLRVMGQGYRNMVTPYARLIHHEGKTRFRHIPTRDIHLGYTHLKDWVARGDPYFNPNLSYAVRTPTFRRRFEQRPIDRLEAIVKYSQGANMLVQNYQGESVEMVKPQTAAGEGQEFAKLLVITHESIGEKMAGPGIRAWELACALGKHGVEVTLATPRLGERSAEGIQLREFSWDDPKTLQDLIDETQVILAAGPLVTRVVHFLGGPLEKPTIVDLYDPAEIERIMLNAAGSPPDFNATPLIIDELFTYLRQGDFFLCGSQEQFDFWMGTLLAAGRLNVQTLGPEFNVDHFIDVVPFGLPDDPPSPGAPVIKGVIPGIAPQDKVIFWGGGIWDWTDPLTLVEAVRVARGKRDDLRVLFGARTHFDQKIVPEMSVVARLMAILEREGWVDQVVFFLDWIPYDQRGAFLLEADIGVSLFRRALENRYAIRSRLYDFLWCQVPCIVSQGDPMSQFLEEAGLARLVEPGDVQGVAQAILDLLEPAAERRSRLSAEDPRVQAMRWTAVVRPILEFLRGPRLAPDAPEARKNLQYVVPLRREWQRMRDEYNQRAGEWAMEREHLLQQVNALRSRRVVRMADRVGGLLNTLKK